MEIESYYGCPRFDTVHLIFDEIPHLDLGNDTFICEDEILYYFLGERLDSVSWSDGRFLHYAFIHKTHDPLSVTIRDSNMCLNSDTVRVIQRPKPDVGVKYFMQQQCFRGHNYDFIDSSNFFSGYGL